MIMAEGDDSGPGKQTRRRSKSGSGEEGSDNQMMCAICLEKYHRPKLLPCFHTFCQSCLQAVAGTATSFPCPACRSPAILPPGGVAALQTNFYIRNDDVRAVDLTAPTRQVCDVCDENREATHSCRQCEQLYCLPCGNIHDSLMPGRGHSLVSVDPEEGSRGGVTRRSPPHTAGVSDGRRTKGEEEKERCGKHSDQRLILHCKQCTLDICLLCKLTLHEGHPTRDVVEDGARTSAELTARHDHRAGVQRKNNDTDLAVVSPGTQMGLVSSGKADLTQTKKDLGKKESKRDARQENSTTVSQTQTRTSVDVVVRTPSQKTRNSIQRDARPDSVAVGKVGTSDDKAAGRNRKKAPREFTYSQDSESYVCAMCPTSNNRLWVKYSTNGRSAVMKLFDENGKVVRLIREPVAGFALVTVLDELTLGRGSSATQLDGIEPSGVKTSVAVDLKPDHLVHGAACGYPFVCQKTPDSAVVRVKFSSTDPLKWTKDVVLKTNSFGRLMDVSAQEKYFAFKIGTGLCGMIEIYQSQGSNDFRLCTSYRSKKLDARDCRFCRTAGREMLLVLVDGEDRVHVVDPADGGRFIRHLDTGPCALNGAHRMATDYDKHVWIGCQSGKVVVVDL